MKSYFYCKNFERVSRLPVPVIFNAILIFAAKHTVSAGPFQLNMVHL